MEWVASTLHTTSEHGVSSITTADAHTRLPVVDWTDAPRRFNGLVRFAQGRNLVSARVSSHFKLSLPTVLSTSGHTVYIGRLCTVCSFSGLTFCAAATGTLPVYFELSHFSRLGLGLSIELSIQSRVVFTTRQTQLYRSCTSGRYSIRLHVSALHISHH